MPELSDLSTREIQTQISKLQSEIDRRDRIIWQRNDDARIEEMKELRKALQEKGLGRRIIVCRESDAYDIDIDDIHGWVNNKDYMRYERRVPYRKIARWDHTHESLTDYLSDALIRQDQNHQYQNSTLLLFGVDMSMRLEAVLFRFLFIRNSRVRYKVNNEASS